MDGQQTQPSTLSEAAGHLLLAGIWCQNWDWCWFKRQRGRVCNIQKQGDILEMNEDLDDWQKHFGKQFNHIFHRVGRIRNYKVQAEYFKNLIPIQQKGYLPSLARAHNVAREGR